MQKQVTTAFAIGLALLALTGCGRNPSTGMDVERVVNSRPKTSTATTAKLPAATSTAKASTSTSSSKTASASTSTKSVASKSTTAKAAATPDPNAPGSLSLKIKLSGTATVGSIALKVYQTASPEDAIEKTLTVKDGAAEWSEAEVGAGDYTFEVKTLGTDGAVLGSGKTETVVKAGEPTEVNLDLRVNAAASTPAATPTPTPEATPKPEATPTPKPVEVASTPTPKPADGGGTLGLYLDIE